MPLAASEMTLSLRPLVTQKTRLGRGSPCGEAQGRAGQRGQCRKSQHLLLPGGSTGVGRYSLFQDLDA